MSRKNVFGMLIAVSLTVMSGCSMCANTHDATYAAFGGSWQREDMCCGRVGSRFAPAGGQVIDAVQDAATPELIDEEQLELEDPAPILLSE